MIGIVLCQLAAECLSDFLQLLTRLAHAPHLHFYTAPRMTMEDEVRTLAVKVDLLSGRQVLGYVLALTDRQVHLGVGRLLHLALCQYACLVSQLYGNKSHS